MPTPALAQLTTGLQTYLDFETGTISNVVAGTSGYTPTITNSGTPVSGFTGSGSRPLLAGNALDLVRSENDFFTISNIGSGAASPAGGLNLGGTFTLSSWHYLDPAAGSPTGNRYFVWEGAADFDVSYGTGGGTSGPDNYTAYATTVIGQTVSLPRNTWNNIVQSFSNDGTNITANLYINGQFIGSNTTLLSNMSWSGLRYGNSRGGGGRAWDGTLDEIGIWSTSLSGAQAQEVYIRGLQGTGLTAATTGVGSWSGGAAGNEWTTAADWTGGTVLGATAAAAASSNAVAIFGGYSLATGLGIDMSAAAANGSLGLGAIVLDSASGTLRIGNSSADTSGVLWLNGATTGAGANTLLNVAGQSDLVIANSPDAANPGPTTLGVTLGIVSGTISIGTGRTATIESGIGEATAGSGFTKTGNGTLVLSGANAYTGMTTISAGALSVASTASLPGWDTTGRFSVAAGAALVVGNAVVDGDVTTLLGTGNFAAGSLLGFDTGAGDRTITGGLSGQTGLAKLSGNTLTLSASNSYAGPTAINGGTLALTGAGDLAGSSGVTLSSATAVFDISAADGSRTLTGLAGVAGSSINLGSNTLVVQPAAAGTFAGGIAGTGSLIKAGTAALTLSGSSTHSGGTTIRAGSIVASVGSATLGTGTVTLNDPQTGSAATGVTVNAELPYGVPLTVANEGSGVSTVTFSGAVTSDAGRTPFTTITLDRAATFDFQTSGAYAFNSPVSGPGPLTIGGNNSYKFAGGSWAGYSGPVTIAPGAAIDLRNRLGDATNTSPLTVNGTMWVVSEETIGPLAGSGSVTTNASYGSGTRSLIVGAGDATGTFSGVLGEASTAAPLRITKTGTGTQTLSGANTFTGGSTIAAGTLALSGAGKLGGSTSPVALTGGRLDLAGTSQTTGALTISAAAAAADTISAGTLTSASYAVSNASGNVTIAASLAGAGGLTKTGAGTLTLTAASTFSSGAAVNAGTLEIGHVNALQNATLSRAAGSVISFNAGAGTYAIGGLSGTEDLNAGANSLTVGGTNVSSTYGGNLTAAALEKVGTGTFTLTNTGHALGSVTVAGGTLVATNAAALGGGSINLAGGRLQYAGAAPVTNGIVLTGAPAGNSIDVAMAMDYLVVGGGGGGAGRDIAGGGGAGGVLSNLTSAAAPLVLTVGGSYAVTVGAGGNGGVNAANGANGGSSSFAGVTALGGGGGGRWNGTPNTGASGGGGGGFGTTAGAAGTAGQGFAGGAANAVGGGGGGAGGIGGSGKPGGVNKAGNGGIGLVVPIMADGLATTLAIGEVSGGQVYFGGGGGGSPHRNNTAEGAGLGGLGGGGDAPATNALAPQAGTANTGGGGAASRSDNTARYTGGRGGSGVVVVRYAGSPQGTGGTVTQGTGADSGYTFHTFKTTGSTNLVLTPARTISGDISGTGGFSFASPGATLTLSGNNTYSGGTVVNAGTVTVGSATALGTGSLTVNAGGTVAFDTPGVSTHALPVVSGGGTLSAGGKTLTIGADNSSSAFAGSITAASLTKSGTGGLGLSGTNTLASTAISSGSITAISSGAFGSGSVTLSGGDLRLGNNVSLANVITLSADAASTTLGVPTVDYLIVGGGGGGAGRDSSGGGGGGGVLSNLIGRGDALLAAGTYSITVGAGGAGGVNTARGSNGGDSVLGSLTAVGGGAGAPYNGTATSGGSGGGGGREGSGVTGAAGTAGPPLQGYAGGNGSNGASSTVDSGGGGGGAGGVGGNAVKSSSGGDGGVGITVPILTASEAASLGIGQVSGGEVYFGGGGGGTPHRGASASLLSGSGGLGGGGNGAVTNTLPGAGVANTGGGGGASRSATEGVLTGGTGGSGVVVVRYLGDAIATGGTITAGTGENAGYTLHTFTAPGTAELAFSSLAATIAGDIGGTGGFTWDSAARLTLSGNNSYAGGTILSAGTLTAGSGTAFGTGTITLASGTTIDLGNYAISNTIVNNGGTILNAGSYGGSQTVDGDSTFSGDVAGTVAIGNGGVGRFRGQVGGRVEIAAGGIAELDDQASVGGSAVFVNDGLLRANRATDMTIGQAISGTGSLQKQGAGRLMLSGTNTYTGGTDIAAGALVVNGSILGNVTLAAGSRLGGSGSIGGTVGGAGIFGPGNSPGVTSVGSIDPTGGLGFEFEITSALPAWANAGASVNDVIRITDGTPFTSALSGANSISVLLDVAGLDPAAPGTYVGGFFTDTAADFTNSIANATFEYWVAGEFGTVGDRQQFATGSGGALEWYTRLPAYDPTLSVLWSTVPTTADFGSGDVGGYSTQFVVVPEPASLALAGLGLAGLAALLRRRRASCVRIFSLPTNGEAPAPVA